MEFDDERPRGRINDGRRIYRESEERGDARGASEPPRYRAPAQAPADPFFDQPYEVPAREAAPSWESAAKPVRVSANIKAKRKVAALFKSE